MCNNRRRVKSFHLVLTLRHESIRSKVTAIIEEYRLQDRVTLLSNLSENDKIQLIKASSVLLYPFQKRAFDITILRAMALGCPVIASNTGAPLEIIGQNGLTGFLLP